MEFILISSPDIAAHTAAMRNRLMTAPLLTAVDGPLGFFDLGTLFVAANGHQTNDTTTLCYDGYGISHHMAFSSGCAAGLPIATANAYLDACLDPVNSNDLRGVFALMRFNPHTKAFTVAPDPLAHYPIFICGLGETLIVSNSYYLIQHALGAMGLNLTRSSKMAATYSAFGLDPSNRTGFREVALLPAGQVITGIGPNWRLVASARRPNLKTKTYSELLTMTAARLCENINAIKKTARDQTIQIALDGGLNSRLLLSAATAAGVKGLETHSHLGRSQDIETGTAVETARKNVFSAQGVPCVPMKTACAGRRRNLFRLQIAEKSGQAKCELPALPKGLVWSNPIKAMQKISSNDPIYGACLAAYWQAGSNRHKKMAAKWAYHICGKMGSLQPLYQKSFLRTATSALIKELADYSAASDSDTHVDFASYLERKNKGIFMRLENMTNGAFDPLLDPTIESVFRKLPTFQKTKADFIGDLIEKMESLSADVRAVKIKNDNTGPKPDVDPNMEDVLQALPDLAALANALPANHEVWQSFHRTKLMAVLNDKQFFLKNRTKTTQLMTILQTFIWAAAAEDTTGVDTLL